MENFQPFGIVEVGELENGEACYSAAYVFVFYFFTQ